MGWALAALFSLQKGPGNITFWGYGNWKTKAWTFVRVVNSFPDQHHESLSSLWKAGQSPTKNSVLTTWKLLVNLFQGDSLHWGAWPLLHTESLLKTWMDVEEDWRRKSSEGGREQIKVWILNHAIIESVRQFRGISHCYPHTQNNVARLQGTL